jgi:hypothetical protein
MLQHQNSPLRRDMQAWYDYRKTGNIWVDASLLVHQMPEFLSAEEHIIPLKG